MFEYFRGRIVEIDENKVIIEVNNIGYIVYIPLREISFLEIGKEYKIFLHKHIYENGEDLYGFFDVNTRKMFLSLMNVSSVGPKIALKILSYLSPSEIAKAIMTNKPEIIYSVKGVSEKVAERIINELKNTIHKLGIKIDEEDNNFDDLVKALRNLGYNQNEILFAINSAKKQNPKLLSLDISSSIQLCLNALREKNK